MDNDATKVDVRCRFALEKLISPDLYELFSQIPTSQHSKLILVMLGYKHLSSYIFIYKLWWHRESFRPYVFHKDVFVYIFSYKEVQIYD